MYPHERSLVEEMKDKPFALVGVNSDRTIERAKKAIAENKLNWRSFQNQEEGRPEKISADWAVKGWSTVVILDSEFKIHYRGHDGEKATEVAKELVAKMAEKGGE
ncbi:MAG: thioredoxin-like domain-containing protein [Planctomycetota bacterium]|nr:thioredoxin-like domain-containing protein [Planctomycetota bacterium]